MITIDLIYEDLLIINKSKFYTFAYPISSEEQAKEYIYKLKKQYADSTHVCSAYSLSSPRIEKADDDGEPSGTAGKPMLELIKKKNIDNVLLVVVRYFGGIKLGAGGLVRAYTNAGNLVLDKANVVSVKEVKIYLVEVDISQSSRLQDVIRSAGGEVITCLYTDKFSVQVVLENIDIISSMFSDAKIESIGSKMICEK